MATTVSVVQPYSVFVDLTGIALEDGQIYIGTAGLNPLIQANRIAVYADSGLTIPLAQPIRTSGGVMLNDNGSPTYVYAAGSSYSIIIQDKLGRLVYSALSAPQNPNILASSIQYDRTQAEITAGVVPANLAIPSHDVLQGDLLLARYGTNAIPGTTDMTTAWLNAKLVAVAAGGGRVIIPAQRIRTTAPIDKPVKVAYVGQGRASTVIEAAHNGKIISYQSGLSPPNGDDDQFAGIHSMGFTNSGGFTPSHGIFLSGSFFTRVSDVRFDTTIACGIELDYVLNSQFDSMNISSATGIKLTSTSVTDGNNLNMFRGIAFSGCATVQLLIDGHGCYQNEFHTCSFFNQQGIGTSIDVVYAAKTRFVNCTFEANLSASMVKLRGGDGFEFIDCTNIDPYRLIDSATFGARNVVFHRPLLWIDTTTTPDLLVNDEITLRDPRYTLDETSGLGSDDEEHHITKAAHSTGRQFASFPGYLNASSTHANSHVTPFGGVIKPAMYNRVGSWNMADGAQWTVPGTAGAADPFGGATAYNMNTIVGCQHGGVSIGAAATGRTFTFQVWAYFVGRVRLGIGTTVGSIKKFANFYSSYLDWHLLSITYTSGVDAGNIPLMAVTTDQNTIMWRPCYYENLGPQPALQPTRDLAGIVGPIEVQDTRVKTYGNAVPAAGFHAIGDTHEQTVPVVGQPKRWRCTVGGTPGTWVSEGNL